MKTSIGSIQVWFSYQIRPISLCLTSKNFTDSVRKRAWKTILDPSHQTHSPLQLLPSDWLHSTEHQNSQTYCKNSLCSPPSHIPPKQHTSGQKYFRFCVLTLLISFSIFIYLNYTHICMQSGVAFLNQTANFNWVHIR